MPQCCTCWTEEFKRSNFLLGCDDPRCFGLPQCGRHPKLYLTYRVIVAAFFVGFVIYLGVSSPDAKWFIYLTNWSILMLAVDHVLQATCASHHLAIINKTNPVSAKDPYTSNPMLYKVTWVFNNVVLSSALLVTIIYWALLYNPTDGGDLSFGNFTVHAFNSIFVVLDMFISGIPVRWLHFFHVLIYGVTYLIFSVVYWAAGGTDRNGNPWIYPILDWGGNPGTSAGLSMGLAIIGVPLFHTFVYGLYRLRLVLFEKCGCSMREHNKQNALSQENIMIEHGSKTSLPDTSIHL